MRELLVGVDAGTTNIKTAAFSLNGDEVAKSSRENELQTPKPGWVEQDMDATWERTAATIRDVVEELGPDDEIIGVGVTAQGDGCWLLDSDGRPVRNAILWSDSRAAPYVTRWKESGVAEDVYDICGSGLFPGASLAILRWLADNEPESVDATETLLYCKDWIKYQLTDELTTDFSDASLPHLDIESGRYSDEVGPLLGLRDVESRLPRLAAGTEIVGRITEEAAEMTGLPVSTPVTSGVLDIIASAFGSGAATPGDSASVVGTTSLNQTLLNDPNTDPSGVGFTFVTGVDGLYSRTMASMAGTPNLNWFIDEFTEGQGFDEIERLVDQIDIGCDGVMYHPYLSAAGERSPFVKTTARAQFTGLQPSHTRSHLIRAVYEGVALAMRDCFVHIPAATEHVYMSGGGAQSELWCQMFADCLQRPVSVPQGNEFGARGAAVLTGVALDRYGGLPEAVEQTTTAARTYEPDPSTASQYEQWYEVYCDTYEALFDVWDHRERVLSKM